MCKNLFRVTKQDIQTSTLHDTVFKLGLLFTDNKKHHCRVVCKCSMRDLRFLRYHMDSSETAGNLKSPFSTPLELYSAGQTSWKVGICCTNGKSFFPFWKHKEGSLHFILLLVKGNACRSPWKRLLFFQYAPLCSLFGCEGRWDPDWIQLLYVLTDSLHCRSQGIGTNKSSNASIGDKLYEWKGAEEI